MPRDVTRDLSQTDHLLQGFGPKSRLGGKIAQVS
jgi:hypothetical protein